MESGELAPKLRAQRCLAVSALAMVGPATASCAALVLIWLVDSRRIPARPRAAILNGIAYYDDSCNQQLGKYEEAKPSNSATISEMSEIGFVLSLPHQKPLNTALSIFGNYSV